LRQPIRGVDVNTETGAPAAPPYRFVSALQLSAVIAALGAQALVADAPWLSLAGFATAMVLFALAERKLPRPAETISEAAPGRWRPAFLALLAAGVILGLGAGVAVYLEISPHLSQALWALALLLLVGAGIGSRMRAGAPRPSMRELVRLALLLLLCGGIFGGLFGWSLPAMPVEVHGDDAEIGNGAIALLEEEPFDVFRSGWFDLPMLHALPRAVALKLLGIDLLALRATSAVLATVTVLALFLLARRLWGPEAAALAAFLLVTQRYFIHLARSGHLYVDTPALAVVALGLFVEAWRRLSLTAAVACGIALGLGIQSYYASRLVPLLLAATFALWLPRSEAALRRRRTACFAVVVLVSAAVAAPMFGFFAHHGEGLMSRAGGTFVFSDEALHHLFASYETDRLSEILLRQMRAALTLFNANGDTSAQYGYRQPLLETAGAAFLALGLAQMLARPADRRGQMVLLWLLAPVIAGGALTIDTPFYPRISGAVPFACLAAALPIQRLLSSIRDASPGPVGRALAGSLVAVLLLLAALNNLWSYFVDYAPGYRLSPGLELSAWIRQHGAGRVTYRIGRPDSFPLDHGTVRFLTHGLEARDVWEPEEFLRAHAFERERSHFIVMPEDPGVLEILAAAAGPLAVEAHQSAEGVLLFYAALPADVDRGEPPAVVQARPHAGTTLASILTWLYDHRPALYGLLGALLLAALGVAPSLRR
jgi:hypothetical protein